MKLISKEENTEEYILIPIKTRETEGGGHSHLFTRDIITAINDLKKYAKKNNLKYYIIAIIIAENWSISEIKNLDNQVDLVFHFNLSPNNFNGFDDESQITLNKYIESILNDG